MDRTRYKRVKTIFLEACERPAHARNAYLDEACAGDEPLRAEVVAMLEAENAEIADALDQSPSGPLHTSQSVEPPRQIGAFRIIRVLGEGGMGQVFEAEQQNPRRRVALKILRLGLALPKLLDRFEHEKDVLARLRHPGIAQVYEAGTAEIHGVTQPYFAMELIEGVPITSHAQQESLSTRERLELLVRVCHAVQHAHQKGVIHRDLKPANILVALEDGQPKILDFGIARAADTDVELTTVGSDVGRILGTLPYMSPEQARADSEEIDVRADVYALGVLLYELLTDRLPYDVKSSGLPEAVRIICEQEPQRISTIHRGLRGDLETIAGKALEKDKERRYPTADALAEDLARYLRNEPIAARPASRLYKLAKFASRNRLFVTALCAFVLSLIVGIVLTTRFALREAEGKQLAERQSYRASMLSAAQQLEANDLDAARRLLDAAPERLRDWEWNYLATKLRHDTPTFVARYRDTAKRESVLSGIVHSSKQIVTVDGDSVVRLWDRRESQPKVVDPPTREPTRPLTLSQDGTLVLSYTNRAAVLWETLSGKQRQRFDVAEAPKELIRTPRSAISPTGTHVLVDQSPHHRLQLFDVASGHLLTRLDGISGTFSSDGAWVVYCSGASVRFFDVVTQRDARPPIAPMRGLAGRRNLSQSVLSPDRTMVGVSGGPLVAVWDLVANRRMHTLERSARPITNLGFAPDGIKMAIADGAMRLWNARTGVVLRSWPEAHSFGAFGVDGRELVGVRRDDADAAVHVSTFDSQGADALVLRGHGSYIYPVAISPDGRTIASGSWDPEIRLWDAETSEAIATITDLVGDRVTGLAFDPRGSRLVSVSASGSWGGTRVEVWNTDTGERLQRLSAGLARTAAFSPDGSVFLTGQHESSVRVFDGRTLRKKTYLKTPGTALAFSPDGGTFATAAGNANYDSNPSIGLWSTHALEPVCEFRASSKPLAVAFSPDGSLLASAEANGAITIWDGHGRSSRPVHSWNAHVGQAYSVVFLSERRLASGGRNGEIRIWEVDTGELVATLRGHNYYVYSLALSSDRTRLVSGSGDRTVRIWETRELAERSRRRQHAASLRAPAEKLADSVIADTRDVGTARKKLAQMTHLDPEMQRQARYALLRRRLRNHQRPPQIDPEDAKPTMENKVLVLDGHSAIRVDLSAALHEVERFTLELWVRGEKPTRRSMIAGNTEKSGIGLSWWNTGLHKRPVLSGDAMSGGSYATVSAPHPPSGEWSHIALCYDGLHMELYVNGNRVDRTVAGARLTPSEASFYIGAEPSGAGAKAAPYAWFKGAIDEVRVSRIARYRDSFTPARVFEGDDDTLLLMHFDAVVQGLHPDASGHERHGRAWGQPKVVAENR